MSERGILVPGEPWRPMTDVEEAVLTRARDLTADGRSVTIGRIAATLDADVLEVARAIVALSSARLIGTVTAP